MATGTINLPKNTEFSGTTPQLGIDTRANHQAIQTFINGPNLQDGNIATNANISLTKLASNVVGSSTAQTLTNKTISLGSNTITGTTAQFNTALSDNDFATLAGSESLSNKTLPKATTIADGTTSDTYEINSDGNGATLSTTGLTADRTFTFPDAATQTLVGHSATQTLTTKTINLASNTLTGTIAEFNTACSDANFTTDAGSGTLTNKTFDLTDNTLNGTLAEFNTACSDADFCSLGTTQTISGAKTFSAGNTAFTSTATTTDAINITANSLTTGAAIQVDTSSSSASNRGLVRVTSTNSSANDVGFWGTGASTTFNAVYGQTTNSSYAGSMYWADCARTASTSYNFFIGISDYDGSPDTEIKLGGSGVVSGDSAAYATPADYAEMFECADSAGLPPGIFVTLDEQQLDKIKPANPGDYILGIISANPACLGDAAWGKWSKRYLKDEFNAFVLDANGERIQNESYDPNMVYVPRGERPEWVAVGMLGKLNVRTLEDVVGNYIDVGAGGHAVNGTTYRVIEIIRQFSDDPDNKGYGVVRVVYK